MTRHTEDTIDRILSACGAGRTLFVGSQIDAAVAAYRRRAIDAEGHDPGWSADVAPSSLPYDDGAFDLVCAEGALDHLDAVNRARAFAELLRVTRRNVLIQASGDSRVAWERACLQQACRKHPLHQMLMPYEGLDWEQPPFPLLFERLPAGLTIGATTADLAAARDLHMDMLREAGRRADAHVARYMFARQFIRPGDRVLDAACGLGYGTAILAEGTLAETVTGLDVDPSAIAYAGDHYGRGHARVRFEARDLSTLAGFPAASLDAIVSFETIEHIADPEAFVAACRRALTPAGRLICSVPNEWINEHGVDPNPHHLHVFDRTKLEGLCRRHFLIEGVFGQTAGAGMKLPEAGRALWPVAGAQGDAEWWLLVGMKDPADDVETPWRAVTPIEVDDRTNVLAFARDYDNPWLLRAMVAIGMRTESAALRAELARHTLQTAHAQTADEGAALCVHMYQHLESGGEIAGATVERLRDYCDRPTTIPHVRRWQISLKYVEGLYWIRRGSLTRAAAALEACAASDALAFSPLLATKTVGAAFLRGWIAVQTRDLSEARRWWTMGITAAERAVHQPWEHLLLNRDAPVVFGLREATAVMDLAGQCATGLALLPHAIDRPGIVAAQLFESLTEQHGRASRQVDVLSRELTETHARASAQEHTMQELCAAFRASILLQRPALQFPPDLRVAVFGAGAGGRLATEALEARGARIACVADNNPERRAQPMNGRAVVDPSTLPACGVDMIAVAVAAPDGRQAIFAQLERLGFQHGRDFDRV